jgi:hypothetical protein
MKARDQADMHSALRVKQKGGRVILGPAPGAPSAATFPSLAARRGRPPGRAGSRPGAGLPRNLECVHGAARSGAAPHCGRHTHSAVPGRQAISVHVSSPGARGGAGAALYWHLIGRCRGESAAAAGPAPTLAARREGPGADTAAQALTWPGCYLNRGAVPSLLLLGSGGLGLLLLLLLLLSLGHNVLAHAPQHGEHDALGEGEGGGRGVCGGGR